MRARSKRLPTPSLPGLTGLDYPHKGHLAARRDPRLLEHLARLADVASRDDVDLIQWSIACCAFWLKLDQAKRVAGFMREVLSE